MQYSKAQIINKLQALGFTAWLYKLGVANSKILSYANAYNYMDTMKKTGHTKAEAVKLTASKFKLTRRTMYNVIREMEKPVDLPKYVEKLVSKNPR